MRAALLPLLLLLIATTRPATFVHAEAPNFEIIERPKSLPEIHFKDAAGKDRALSDFKGRIVVLNIWATWCVPCREEMPALDRLQGALGGDGFEVVALSIDRGGLAVVRKFFAEVGVSRLATYVDSSGLVLGRLRVVGLPTTLLIDRAGHEIARRIGPAEWDTPATISAVRRLIDERTGARAPSIDTRLAQSPAAGRQMILSREQNLWPN